MLTTRSAPTACLSMSQQSLMKRRCVLASCRAGLWSSFKHLAGFLKLKRMPRRSLFTQLLLGRASSSSESSHPCTRLVIVTALRHSTSVTRMMCSLSRVMSAGDSRLSCRASLLVARSASSGRECSGRSRRTLQGTGAGPRTSTAACPSAARSSTGPACRGTSRGRWGRRGSCGASMHCCWARLQRARRPGQHKAS